MPWCNPCAPLVVCPSCDCLLLPACVISLFSKFKSVSTSCALKSIGLCSSFHPVGCVIQFVNPFQKLLKALVIDVASAVLFLPVGISTVVIPLAFTLIPCSAVLKYSSLRCVGPYIGRKNDRPRIKFPSWLYENIKRLLPGISTYRWSSPYDICRALQTLSFKKNICHIDRGFFQPSLRTFHTFPSPG